MTTLGRCYLKSEMIVQLSTYPSHIAQPANLWGGQPFTLFKQTIWGCKLLWVRNTHFRVTEGDLDKDPSTKLAINTKIILENPNDNCFVCRLRDIMDRGLLIFVYFCCVSLCMFITIPDYNVPWQISWRKFVPVIWIYRCSFGGMDFYKPHSHVWDHCSSFYCVWIHPYV